MPAIEKKEQPQEQTPVPTVKPIDSYFTIEHQGMIASKYRVKYSDADQAEHKALWPEFTGNHFTMYILAETLLEARKAVFSANRQILLNGLISAMDNYTPTVPDAVLTELQVAFNKTSELSLQSIVDKVPEDSQKVELLKAYKDKLKKGSKTGKEMEQASAKFAHTARTFGIVPSTIW